MLADILSTDNLNLAAQVFTIVALVIAIFTWRSNMQATRNIQHYSLVSQADEMFEKAPNLLRFHGIDPDSIEEQYGVSPTDLSYLLQLFNAGSISNLLSSDGGKEPFTPDDYSYGILKNEATKRALPLVALLFSPTNKYIGRCKATVAAMPSTPAQSS